MIKQSIVLLILIHTAHSSHAMDNFSNDFFKAIQHDDPQPTKENPHFSLYQCDSCNKPCNQRCQCRGVYYCSKGCQRARWQDHKTDCQEIKNAFSGNQKQMENFFKEYLQAASESSRFSTGHQAKLPPQSRKKTIDWMLRLLIHNHQETITNNKSNLSESSLTDCAMLTLNCCKKIKDGNLIEELGNDLKNKTEKAALWIVKHVYPIPSEGRPSWQYNNTAYSKCKIPQAVGLAQKVTFSVIKKYKKIYDEEQEANIQKYINSQTPIDIEN